jgi:hypothetical protein
METIDFNVRAVVIFSVEKTLKHPAKYCFVIRVQDEVSNPGDMEIYVEDDDFRVSLADPKAFQKTANFIVEQSRKNCKDITRLVQELDITLMKWQKRKSRL